MGITIHSGTRFAFEDARQLITALEEAMPPEYRGKLRTARELVTEVEDQAADSGHLS